ncbi:winged helix-turn-helix domain-containing protein [Falsiroseomonas sp. HW251]|uniref:winged helix-turn-helix domain-containing protein n=1 Tax=Falsiroseomonas sp. HW251 TaxID=3390998 RepID=UPI003D314FEA
METPRRIGRCVLDPARGALRDEAGLEIALRPKSWDMLLVLARHAGRVLSKDELLDAVWPGIHVTEDSLVQAVRDIRRAIGDAEGRVLRTVAKRGYLLDIAEAAAAPDRPSVVVLPFAHLGADPSQAWIADAVADDLTSVLARVRWLFVVARSTAFTFRDTATEVREIGRRLGVRYALEGSLRSDGDRLRVSCRLVGTEAGHHLWSGTSEGSAADIFAFQDEVTRRVLAAIEPALLESEASRAVLARRGDPSALELVRQGIWHFHKVTREGHATARALFVDATRRDPALCEGWTWLARVSAGRIAYGWAEDRAAEGAAAIAAGLRAVELDDRDPYAHYAYAIASAYAGEPQDTVRAGETVVAMLPFFALGHLVRGMGLLFAGDAAPAAESLAQGLALNPDDPQNFVWQVLRAVALLVDGRPREAREAAMQAARIRPGWRPAFEVAACCAMADGDRAGAASFAAKAAALPLPSGDVLAPFRARNPGLATRLDASLAEERSQPG